MPQSGIRSAQSGTRALIVEDDALLAMMIGDTLNDAGIADVHSCASIAEAMASLSAALPTILVLDVNLADRQDGWTLAELAMQVSAVPPLIVFSTASPEAIPDHIAALGHVLTKPYAPEQLLAVIVNNAPRAGLLERLRKLMS